MSDVVPLFPLGYVLLPGSPLPLHIFERRYRQLLSDIDAGLHARAFGVVHEGGRDSKLAAVGHRVERDGDEI